MNKDLYQILLKFIYRAPDFWAKNFLNNSYWLLIEKTNNLLFL